jgi:hypothetical protein
MFYWMCAHRNRLLSWLSFATSVGLTLHFVWQSWGIIGPSTYAGGDGKSLQAGILAFLNFTPPFEINTLSPIQGLAEFATPVNVWGNPVLWPFLYSDLNFATQASTMIAYFALAVAIFVLARTLCLPLAASIAGAVSAIIVMPPFFFVTGFNALFAIIPGATMNGALAIIAAMLTYRVQSPHSRTVVITGTMVALVLGYAVYVDPGWFLGSLFVFVPLFAFCILDAPSLAAILGRAAVFMIAFIILYMIGLVDYVRTLFTYTARIYLQNEWSRAQDLAFASSAFVSPLLKWTYFFFLTGWLLGLIFGASAARKIAFLCFLLFSVFLAEAALYLFASFDWSGPLPAYCEVFLAPIYALGAVIGYFSVAAVIWNRFVVKVNTAKIPRMRGIRLLQHLVAGLSVFVGIALVPAVLVWFNNKVIYGTPYTPGLVNILNEPWPSNSDLVTILQTHIALRKDPRFRGTALVQPYWDYPSQLAIVSLWKELVPTLNIYGTFQSPVFHYFLHRMPKPGAFEAINESTPIAYFWWRGSRIDGHSDKLLQALGVRYLVQSDDGDSSKRPVWSGEDLHLRTRVPPISLGGKTRSYDVYEYDNPNLGDYSPTEIVVAHEAAAILRIFWQESFDPERTVVLGEQINTPLVTANHAEFQFERGAIHVKAQSAGRSLLLLPVHYSRCLSLDANNRGKLLRANLVQTGLLFEGHLDAHIHLRYGLFQTSCRNEDLADLRVLGIKNDQQTLPWSFRHPHAVSSLAEIPDALQAALRKIPYLN